MAIAYYMVFEKGHSGAQDRVGGQPTHIPPARPWKPEDDQYFGFLMQLRVDGVRLRIPGAVYLQLYQTTDESDDPQPEVIQIPPGAALNEAGDILVHPDAGQWDIRFEKAEDPDFLPGPISSVPGRLFQSKLGGLDPWGKDKAGRVFLGQISQSPVRFNFADMICSLYLEPSGEVTAELS